MYILIDPFLLAFFTQFAEMACFLLLVRVLLQDVNFLGSVTTFRLQHEFLKFLIYMGPVVTLIFCLVHVCMVFATVCCQASKGA